MKAYRTTPMTKDELITVWQALNNYSPQGTRSVHKQCAEAFEAIDAQLDQVEEQGHVVGFELSEDGEEAAEKGLLLDRNVKKTFEKAMKNAFTSLRIWRGKWCGYAASAAEKIELAEEVPLRPDDTGGDEVSSEAKSNSTEPEEDLVAVER